jgi:hypothetical protein
MSKKDGMLALANKKGLQIEDDIKSMKGLKEDVGLEVNFSFFNNE